MKTKQAIKRPFLLSTTLIVLSILALLLNAAMLYTWIFYSEAQKGLAVYLSETFALFPFIYIYASFLTFSILLLLSVVLMWMRKKTGLYLYYAWSLALMLFILFSKQIDWYNLVVLLVLCILLITNNSYFSFKPEDAAGADSDSST